jgi:hypothetical protein
MRFSAWVKGEAVGTNIGLHARACDADGDAIARSDAGVIAAQEDDSGWRRVEGTLIVPPGTHDVVVLAFCRRGGEAWFDDVSAVADGPATAQELIKQASSASQVPGLFRLRGHYVVRISGNDGIAVRLRRLVGSEPKFRPALLIPMPLSYGQQVPITYHLAVKPADRLHAMRVYEDRPGNYVVEIVFEPSLGEQEFELGWSSIVLSGPGDYARLPATAPMPESWPPEALPWLRSTATVQADSREFKELAGIVRLGGDDVLGIIEHTILAAKEVHDARQGVALHEDAVSALWHQTKCVGNANLVAALLRASGVPARILGGYPASSGPLGTHFTVEAYVPGFGWYPIEPTLLQAPWPPCGQQQVAIIPPEYEGRSRRRGFYPQGTPYLAHPEERDDRGAITLLGLLGPPEKRQSHESEIWRAFSENAGTREWDEALSVARQRWERWLSTAPECGPGGYLATPIQIEDLQDVDRLDTLAQALRSSKP